MIFVTLLVWRIISERAYFSNIGGVTHGLRMGIVLYIFVCLFHLIQNVPVSNLQLCRDGSSWVEPVQSKDNVSC